MGGRGGDAKTIISPNTSFGDIIKILIMYLIKYMYNLLLHYLSTGCFENFNIMTI